MGEQRRSADRARDHLDRSELWIQCAIAALSALVGGGALLWAVAATVDGRTSVGDVSLLISALASLQSGVLTLVREIGKSFAHLALFDHYLQVVTSHEDLRVAPHPTRIPALQSGIEFRNVWFRYTSDHNWVLKDVSFTVPAGRSVGIVGKNGAGKTTVIKLLLRMYDPDQGAILWDGIDLRELDPGELRARVGAVFQDFMCYDLTAADNIRLGNLDCEHGEIEEAAKRSGASRFLGSLPNGYRTLLSRIFVLGEDASSELGTTLSGGQWQRLALARAYLRVDRDLLILDEPSSGLDAEAEYEIHESLQNLRKNRTCLLISHRLGTLRDADGLVVLAEGTVAEAGTHDELLASAGLYARLFRMQASGYTNALAS
jgi:ATP-binding cassette subfamily B protein